MGKGGMGLRWGDGVGCPRCGSKSEVATGKPPERWRKCLNRKCNKFWRTQEVYIDQANEMLSWYTEMVEKRGSGWAPLIEAAGEMYERARKLAIALGVLNHEEGNNAGV